MATTETKYDVEGKPIIPDANEAAVAAGTMRKVPIGQGFGYMPVGSAGDILQQQIETNVPTDVKAPQLPIPTAPEKVGDYFISITAKAETDRKTLEDTYKKNIDEINRKKDDAQKRIDELDAKQEKIIGEGGPVDTLAQPFRQTLETSERDRLNIEKNFFANQKLTDELDSLLTEGNAVAEKLRSQKIPGLAGIQQSSRSLKNLETISARVGVINAVMNARSGQITEGYRLIDRSVEAINADRKDRLNYYSTLFNFYEGQKDTEGNKLINLDKDQKKFLDAQIGLIEHDVAQSEKNANYIKGLMVDPDTAGYMADAGVTLNDTPEQVNAKMAAQTKRKEVEKQKNDLTSKGYEFVPFPQPGDKDIVTLDVGGQKLSFKKPAPTAAQTETVEVNGRKLLINSTTGETIRDLGAATGGVGSIAQSKEDQATVNLYSSTIDKAIADGATPEEAVLAAAVIADNAGTKLDINNQNALLNYARGDKAAGTTSKAIVGTGTRATTDINDRIAEIESGVGTSRDPNKQVNIFETAARLVAEGYPQDVVEKTLNLSLKEQSVLIAKMKETVASEEKYSTALDNYFFKK